MTPTIAWTEEREAWTDASVGDLPSKDEGWLSTVVRRDTGGHANNPPSAEQTVKTQPKEVFLFHFSSFLTVYLLLKCRFVA